MSAAIDIETNRLCLLIDDRLPSCIGPRDTDRVPIA